MKAIYDKLAEFYERDIAGCETCEATGYLAKYHEYDAEVDDVPPCPTCVPLRERLKGLLRKETCQRTGCAGPDCEGCEDLGPPNLTTHLTGSKPTVRVLLEEAGLLERFRVWHIEACTVFNSHKNYPNAGWALDRTITTSSITDILTDLTLLCQAVDSFLQEVNSG